MCKFSRFSFSMGFSFCGGASGIGDGVLAISVSGGMCSCIGGWFELRLMLLFVVEVY